MIFVLDSHAADALSAIHIEEPQRYSVEPGNAGQEAGERFGGVISGDYKIAVLVQAVQRCVSIHMFQGCDFLFVGQAPFSVDGPTLIRI